MAPRIALVSQGGGPTAVANRTLFGAVDTFINAGKPVYGVANGWVGMATLTESLCKFPSQQAERDYLAAQPAFILGAERSIEVIPGSHDFYNGKQVSAGRIVTNMIMLGVDSLCIVGGNSTAKVAKWIQDAAQKLNYPLAVVVLPKTIDNDLIAFHQVGEKIYHNDHTPGHGSAARANILKVNAFDADQRSCRGIMLTGVMGRTAGDLTLSTALARQDPSDGPHLFYLPERPFTQEQLLNDVSFVLAKYGRAHIMVSEGARVLNGTTKDLVELAVEELGLKDAPREAKEGTIHHSACLPMALQLLTQWLRGLGETIRPGLLTYYSRSDAYQVSPTDAIEARRVGEEGALLALRGKSGTVLLVRSEPYSISYVPAPLEAVKPGARQLADRFINSEGNGPTQAYLDFIAPIVGELPFAGPRPKVHRVSMAKVLNLAGFTFVPELISAPGLLSHLDGSVVVRPGCFQLYHSEYPFTRHLPYID